MTNRSSVGMFALGIALVAFGSGIAAYRAKAESGKTQPEPKGKITPWTAIKIATAKVPGRPLQANFEFDEGKWVYGVMIVSGKTIKEVEVDPASGKVGSIETVTPEGEAREMRDQLQNALGGKANATSESEEKEAKRSER